MEHHLFRGPVPILQEYESYEDYKIATDRWNDYVAVGSKTENMRNCLDYALVGVSLTDWVPLLAGNDSQFKCVDFPLYHPDLKFKKISSFLGEDETGPGEFTEDESQYFSCVGPERQALSRYLTMVTEMNPTFVADMRLWKCITAYLNERESFMYLRDQERTPSRKRKLDYCV
ncbi:uncharacterized protein NFIA_036090 [Aspergillus fischeri NRRL 181]|uniref:Uncharacterized protein n=1 Tax=Neosartorya fischeri (strain ATCC 1020 / DSM 3700 / CBS 544.65 / FGSC A1164 / JCM 1740 / NRRL 181 / WB 181) TaxID=331117 RepID=A1CZ67_NEOFI|nr:uncharacterized protein NFIA_036090 [Aspergillus fischeri NRRL 181]EAW24037.1 hypothetical protein NFIA_036090 [Aspergillus fischeri NRRL 181]